MNKVSLISIELLSTLATQEQIEKLSAPDAISELLKAANAKSIIDHIANLPFEGQARILRADDAVWFLAAAEPQATTALVASVQPVDCRGTILCGSPVLGLIMHGDPAEVLRLVDDLPDFGKVSLLRDSLFTDLVRLKGYGAQLDDLANGVAEEWQMLLPKAGPTPSETRSPNRPASSNSLKADPMKPA